MRIYLPQKDIHAFTEAVRQRRISLLRVDTFLCLPKLKSIAVLLYYFSCSTFTFVVEAMFNLKTFSQV